MQLLPAAPNVEQSPLVARLADSLANAGRGAEAAPTYVRACDGAPDEVAFDLRRKAAEQWLYTGHIDEGLVVLREVLAGTGEPYPRSPRRALWGVIRGQVALAARGTGYREQSSAAIARSEIRRLEALWTATAGVGFTDVITSAYFSGRYILGALRLGELGHVARALGLYAVHTATAGVTRRDKALRLADHALALAPRLEDPYPRAYAVAINAVCRFSLGEWRTAHDLCRRAETLLQSECVNVAVELANIRSLRMAARLLMGDYEPVIAELPGLLRDAEERGNLYATTAYRSWRTNQVWLALDDHELASAHVERADREWSRQGYHQQHLYVLIARSWIDLYAGRAGEALDRVHREWPAVRRSMLLRLQTYRIELMRI
ncbi:MAG: hypothetical protein ACREI7_10235, partial [Myxococcota bacterium]